MKITSERSIYIKKMQKHNSLKIQHCLDLMKNLADVIIGLQLTGVSGKLLKFDFGESMIGIAGVVSSVIGIF